MIGARRATRFAFAGMALAFAILGTVAALSLATSDRQIENARWVDHTHVVIETVGTMAQHLAEARRAGRLFLLTGADDDLAPYPIAVDGMRDVIQELRTLTSDNATQGRSLDRLELMVQTHFAHLDDAIAQRRSPQFHREDAIDLYREADVRMAQIAPILKALLDEERRLLVLRSVTLASSGTRNRIAHVVGLTVSFGLLALVFVGLHRELRRRVRSEDALQRSEVATKQLNDELEHRVRARTAELQTSNLALETFSYSVAHDLRAPLRGLSGFAEVLLDEYKGQLDADGIDALQEIRDNAHKMGVLIDALLSLARVTRGELRSEAVDLSALVRSVARDLDAAEHREQLDLVVADGVVVDMDPDLARMLVKHLIENAWKFTSKVGATRIEFGTRQQDTQRTYFVADNGAGFDPAHAAKLFVPFHRMHTVGEFPGTGIGLSTAQRIVARYGGQIWAEGQVANGATFYFTLSGNPQEAA
jgi:signal transduction histidine kinase